MPRTIEQIVRLYRGIGAAPQGMKDVTQEQHALQCASLAERAGAGCELVAAALLHDLGHLLQAGADEELAHDDLHELRAFAFLQGGFPRAVLDPIRLHVLAKRYLCGIDAAYWDRLCPASKRSLALQGGPLRAHEAKAFLAEPYAHDAIALRQWDDQARTPARRTAGWDHYRHVLEEASLRSREALAA